MRADLVLIFVLLSAAGLLAACNGGGETEAELKSVQQALVKVQTELAEKENELLDVRAACSPDAVRQMETLRRQAAEAREELVAVTTKLVRVKVERDQLRQELAAWRKRYPEASSK